MFNECPGSRTLKLLRNGAQGHMEYLADTWDEAIYYCPKPGNNHPLWPDLTVDTVDITGEGAALTDDGSAYGNPIYATYRIRVEYTLDYKKLRPGDDPRVTYDIGVEMLNTAEGQVWLSTGRKAGPGITQAIPFAAMPFTVEAAYTAATIPIAGIFATVGCINIDPFVVMSADTGLYLIDVEAETTFFEGAQIMAQYDFDTRAWYFRVSFKFTWRRFSQNIMWRAPDYITDRFGNELYYQSDDPTGAHYTIDDTLLNLPVPRGDASGTAGWDEFVTPNYSLVDFNILVI